jgi:hypothetical protein
MYKPELVKIAQTLRETPFPKKLAVEITADKRIRPAAERSANGVTVH